MERSIRNGTLSIKVKQKGAELCSLIDPYGTEYMWQADPEIWGFHSPILFPIIGQLPNGSYTYKEKIYNLTPHGFARHMDFELIKESADTLQYRLQSSPETEKAYPFTFILFVEYRMAENRIEVHYKVKNNGPEKMYFSIGGHPAFSLNWIKDSRIEYYYLEFEKNETLETHTLDNHLLSNNIRKVLNNEKLLFLHKDIFNQNALIFLNRKSNSVTLCSHKSSNRLTVEFPGFTALGIWAKPGAPFVCIEPWYGFTDPSKPYGSFENKPGIINLDSGKEFTCVFNITIN